jgi:dienelactone hydrolase
MQSVNQRVENKHKRCHFVFALAATLLIPPTFVCADSEDAEPLKIRTAPSDDLFGPYLTQIPPSVMEDSVESRADGAVELRHVIFRSRTFGNRESRVYAVVARPTAPGTYPGILILHGGAAAAEVEKAVGWAARGYIAVAPDLPGIGTPDKMPYSSGPWKDVPYASRHMAALPDATASSIFDGVVAAVQSLYLLRAQPGVETKKVGVVGISWGGYATTMVASLTGKDVAAAYSVFGSGYYDQGSFWQKNLSNMSTPERENWLAYLDAGRHAHKITAPYFVAAAANDTYFWPPAVMATLERIRGTKNQYFSPNADHQIKIPSEAFSWTQPAWVSSEYSYFDHYLKGVGGAWPVATVGDTTHQPDGSCRVRVHIESSSNVKEASIYYSTPEVTWLKRNWIAVKASTTGTAGTASGGTISSDYEATIPAEAVSRGADWFALATDERAITTGTLVLSVGAAKP